MVFGGRKLSKTCVLKGLVKRTCELDMEKKITRNANLYPIKPLISFIGSYNRESVTNEQQTLPLERALVIHHRSPVKDSTVFGRFPHWEMPVVPYEDSFVFLSIFI